MGKYGRCFNTMYDDYNYFLKKYKKQDLALKEYIKAIYETTKKDENLQVHYRSRVDLFINDVKGNLIHYYFLDQSLKVYLMEMDIPDKTNIHQFLMAQGGNPIFNILSETEKYTVDFCIHFPNDSFGYSIKIAYDEVNKDFIFHIIHEAENDFFAYLKNVQNSEVWPICKLVINALFYINCFPDCIVDGIPKGMKLINEFTNPKKQIRVSEKLLPYINKLSNHIISPHFRMGHFRYLGSNYYVNKKGQTIFIEPTFVKGNSKIVLTDEKVKKEIEST